MTFSTQVRANIFCHLIMTLMYNNIYIILTLDQLLIGTKVQFKIPVYSSFSQHKQQEKYLQETV